MHFSKGSNFLAQESGLEAIEQSACAYHGIHWYTTTMVYHGIPWYVYHHHGTTTTDLEDSISVRASHKKTPLNRFNPTHTDLPDWVVLESYD